MIRVARLPFAALLLLPSLALASVGEVSVLEGQATRAAKDGSAPVALKVGSEIELGDTLKVAKGGNLKLTLSDKSVLMVGSESVLEIEEAKFSGLNRERFSAKLSFGKVWAHVTKALSGSEQNFEVKTDRAVAGVRGTIFRVDATKLFDNAQKTAPAKSYTVVRVMDGKVKVDAKKVSSKAKETAPEQLLAQVGITTPAQAGGKKPRQQIAGPRQVSLQEWEARFAELQREHFVAVGDDVWHAGVWDPKADNDAFAQFVNKNSAGASEP